ncbi:MAG: sulfate reduction electron transfer complex DsrMKJOP subunit DsrM [Nitrospirae bacterium]|nr:sulfate reduction electron transfer complex DsrMKJOP subunit DsrM [Nitrospirota bacterium]MBF0535254.1 sulfate reduction electron transfer complex DsrMKJOP subunit DsrM [Nitrospirota bacterium]MBF0615266.1 sulfate reduction electron transfer complex DsrMKJOP subunit DsrM [Nitrospirota bacterium]
MKILLPFLGVMGIVIVAFVGVEMLNLQYLFGVMIPYTAFIIFVVGVVLRILKWGRSAVPFCIPTTSGQQKSFSWIKRNRFDNPSNNLEVIVRMALEVLLFRSLFSNTSTALKEDEGRLIHQSSKWLWLGGLAFHWSFLIVLVRHLRLFLDPIPSALSLVEGMDGLMQLGVPVLYWTGLILLISATYLFFRRVVIPQVSYFSLPNDHFPLLLILFIATTGMIMRYILKVDIISVKAFTVGLFSLKPTITHDLGLIFYIHLFLVSVLLAYFPFSKLMHAAGVFLSPTRNMPNNSRRIRHINPWNYPVKVHTYEEYEDDFRDKMKTVGLPLEKE